MPPIGKHVFFDRRITETLRGQSNGRGVVYRQHFGLGKESNDAAARRRTKFVYYDFR